MLGDQALGAPRILQWMAHSGAVINELSHAQEDHDDAGNGVCFEKRQWRWWTRIDLLLDFVTGQHSDNKGVGHHVDGGVGAKEER